MTMKHEAPRARSSVVVARLLSSDGFNEHAAAIARGYWRRIVASQTDRAQKRIQNIEDAFHEIVSPQLTAAQKQALGKFISLREKAAFDTGLRVGLTTQMFPEAKGAEKS